jgi:DNA-binding transcriptional ArsR family regulator
MLSHHPHCCDSRTSVFAQRLGKGRDLPRVAAVLDCSFVSQLFRDDQRSKPPLARLGIALGDPVRQKILLRLFDGPAFPSELAELARTTRSNLSNHLACLRGCCLVVTERQGRNIRYELATRRLGGALADVATAMEESVFEGAHGR